MLLEVRGHLWGLTVASHHGGARDGLRASGLVVVVSGDTRESPASRAPHSIWAAPAWLLHAAWECPAWLLHAAWEWDCGVKINQPKLYHEDDSDQDVGFNSVSQMIGTV